MSGWGRPLASARVSDPPLVTSLPPLPPRAWSQDVLGPVGVFGIPPSRFRSDFRGKSFLGNPSQRFTRIRSSQVTAEAWVAVDRTPTFRITQVSAEAWTRNFKHVLTTFYYPRDRMGPVGFLGVPPSTFWNSERLQITVLDPQPSPTTNIQLIQSQPLRFLFGPMGPRTLDWRPFIGRPGGGTVVPIIPTVRIAVTQLSAEIFVASNRSPVARVPQVSAESWVTSNRQPTIRTTQLSSEVWVIAITHDFLIPPFLWVD